MTTLKDTLALLAILACYGILGHMEYDDAVHHEEHIRGTGMQKRPCAHDLSATSADAPPAALDDLTEAQTDRDCQSPSL